MTDTAAAPSPPPGPTAKALGCPNCGGTIQLRAAGVTTTLVCEHCGSTLDATDPHVRLIAAANDAMRRPEIALGTRGTVDGVQWEVVGYLERSDGETAWAEYLLFNPYEGYAFLVDDGVRFSLGRLTDRNPGWGNGGPSYAGETFKLFGETYPVRVHFVVGEFYWRVTVGEEVQATDYVAVGDMLSCEENGAERTWTYLRMLDVGVAERAFGLESRQTGGSYTPAPHEPNPHAKGWREAKWIGIAAAVGLVVLAIGQSGETDIGGVDVTVPMDGTTKTTVVGPIDLPAGRQRVKVEAIGPQLDNAWIDVDYSLVERKSQTNYDSWATVEYYHGRDSDGDWSEGNRSPAIGLASIPKGQYDLVVDLAAHRWSDPKASSSFWSSPAPATGGETPVRLEIARGGTFGGNLFLALLLVGLWPLWKGARYAAFETRRRSVLGDDDDGDDDE
jgi:hypothetical protein